MCIMRIFKSSKEENQWMSISDLMSVLMMIFLFISIVYMRSVNLEKNKITSIAQTYETTQVEITNDLKKEFTKNLQIWNAVLDRKSTRLNSSHVSESRMPSSA